MKWISADPIAHRGLHGPATGPENSFSAFRAAIQEGYPIELDVHLLKDGSVVVFHDHDLCRMTGFKGLVRDQSIEKIRSLRLLSTQDRVPEFQEVLRFVNGRVPILVELKVRQKVGPLESALCSLLADYANPVAIQSFNPWTLAWFKNNAPHIPRGQLSGDFSAEDYPSWKKFVLQRMWLNYKSQPHFIGYDHRCLPNRWVRAKQTKRHLPILAYTIRSKAEQVRALQFSDNIIFEDILP